MCRAKGLALAALAAALCAAPALAQSADKGAAVTFAPARSIAALATPATPARRHTPPAQALGVELGFLSVPLLTPDPYSFASSAGLWYEHSLGEGSPLVGGLWLDVAGFKSLDANFGDSLMYYGGLELGYRLELLRYQGSEASLRPLVRLGWYARGIDFLGQTDWGSRPFVSAGCLISLRWGALDLGWLALVSMPMDNRTVVLLGVLQRIGICF